MTDHVDTLDRTAALRRPSGAYAMLAVDQREAMRLMFAGDAAPLANGSTPPEVVDAVPDAALIAFKVAAARALTPYASAVLIDTQFAWDAVRDADAVDPSCALIASADRFVPGHGEAVTDAVVDEELDAAAVAAQGARALKLLVIHRPDEPAAKRIALVEDFVARAHAAGLAAIIEPVCKAPRDDRDWDHDAAIVEVAAELGGLGADLYKAEVPLQGTGTDDELLSACRALDAALPDGLPWVVLSSGVAADDFPRAVRLACAAGASGFLAGRAVWRACIGAPDLEAALRDDAVPRLQRLVGVVDEAVGSRAR